MRRPLTDSVFSFIVADFFLSIIVELEVRASPRGSTRDVRVLRFAGDTRDEPREGRRARLPQSARRMSSLKENNSFVSGSQGSRLSLQNNVYGKD